MRTAPLFKYFGSKWLRSRHYPAPRHEIVIEPFAGSACYSLYWQCRNVILCETAPRVAALWDWLINVATPDDVMSLPCASLEPGQCLVELGRQLGLHPGAVELIIRWQRVGRGDCKTVSKWNNINTGFWSESTKRRIVETLPLIKGWTVHRGSGLDLCGTHPVTWFIDPPYQGQSASVYEGGQKLDYGTLATWVESRRGLVIVCEQEGAEWLPFQAAGAAPNGRRRKASNEVVYVKGLADVRD